MSMPQQQPLFSLNHFIQGFLKPHRLVSCNELFISGGPYTTPHVSTIEARIPSLWRSACLLIMLVTLCIVFVLAEQYSRIWLGNTKLFLSAVAVGSAFAPLGVVVLLSELNLWRNITVMRMSYLIAGGGLLSVLFALFMYLFSAADSALMTSLMAGLIEEPAKVAAAIVLAGRNLRNGKILNGILIGAGIGAGFTLIESMGYSFEGLFSALHTPARNMPHGLPLNYENALSVMGVRALFCLTAGHVTWSALACGALWAVKDRRRTSDALTHPVFLAALLFCSLLHGGWNLCCALSVNLHALPVFIIVTWGVLGLVIRSGIMQIREEQVIWYDTCSEREAIFSIHRADGTWAQPVTAAALQDMVEQGKLRPETLCRAADCALPVPLAALCFIESEPEPPCEWWRFPRCSRYWTGCMLGAGQLVSYLVILMHPLALDAVLIFLATTIGQLMVSYLWLGGLWERLKRLHPETLVDEWGAIPRPDSKLQLWEFLLVPFYNLYWGYRQYVDLIRTFNATRISPVQIPLWIPRLYWGTFSLGVILLGTIIFLGEAGANLWQFLLLLLLFPLLAFFMARALNGVEQHLRQVE